MGQLWDHSNQIEWYSAAPAVGAKAYFYQGNTTTPIAVYQDAAEATPHADPVVADGNGRWPSVFIPFIASFDVRATTSGGTQLYYPRAIPNPDPVEASVDSIDDNQLLQTGDIIFAPKTGTRSGFVRVNGRTIGSASSGATERANADTSDLFEYLWNNFANGILAVSGGRGGSAAADFAANKPIALLDGRSGTLRGVSDMGNSSDSLLASATFTTGDATTGGSWAGANTHVITTAQMPVTTPAGSISQITPAGSISQITPAGTVSRPTVTVTNGVNVLNDVAGAGGATSGSNRGLTTITAALNSDPVFTGTPTTPTFTGTPTTPTFTGTPFGSGSAHNNVSKSILGNFLQKL